MNAFNDFWNDLSVPRRWSLVGGVLSIALLAAGMLYLLARPNHALLFSGLEESEAAQITAALEKLKVPYRLDAERAAVLVEEGSVYQTRLELAQEGLPLAGGKGFELFDDADYGMTEFAQKINYQRALQGELSRTISAIPEIKYARVHLVLPERTLFSSETRRPSAAITVLLREGETLNRIQVDGIQSLVAASVEGMDRESVRILDSRGVELSQGDPTAANREGQLELRERLGRNLELKIKGLLEPALGADAFRVSVDVTLDASQRKRMTETPHAEAGAAPIVRHQQSHKSSAPGAGGKGEQGLKSVTESFEKEYALGRIVEEVTEDGIRVSRLAVGVVITQPLSAEQIESVRQLITSSLGLDTTRGDTLAVEYLKVAQVPLSHPGSSSEKTSLDYEPALASSLPRGESGSDASTDGDGAAALLSLLALGLAALAGGVVSALRRRGAASKAQKEQLLEDIRSWARNGSGERVA